MSMKVRAVAVGPPPDCPHCLKENNMPPFWSLHAITHLLFSQFDCKEGDLATKRRMKRTTYM